MPPDDSNVGKQQKKKNSPHCIQVSVISSSPVSGQCHTLHVNGSEVSGKAMEQISLNLTLVYFSCTEEFLWQQYNTTILIGFVLFKCQENSHIVNITVHLKTPFIFRNKSGFFIVFRASPALSKLRKTIVLSTATVLLNDLWAISDDSWDINNVTNHTCSCQKRKRTAASGRKCWDYDAVLGLFLEAPVGCVTVIAALISHLITK